MDQFKKYNESVRSPVLIRLALSLFIGLVFLGGLISLMYPGTQTLPALIPSLVFVLVVGALAFLLLSLFYKVSIRVSKKFLARSAEKEMILRISGVKKEGSSYIPCKNILALEIRPYDVPGFASILPFYPRKGKKDEQIILMPGYSGEGILLTYTYESFFSQKEKTHKVLFPSNDATHLLEILKGITGRHEKN